MKPDSELAGMVEFLAAAERLKVVTRSGWTSDGQKESVAEHSWRLCLWAIVFGHEFGEIDVGKLVRMCVVHDLGEAIGGDVPAPEQAGRPGKAAQERRDLLDLLRPLPERLRLEFASLWDEYEAASTPEARIAKALDKLETIMQHNQGSNPAGFDYRFNIGYGRRYTEHHPVLDAVRKMMDRDTNRRAREAADHTNTSHLVS